MKPLLGTKRSSGNTYRRPASCTNEMHDGKGTEQFVTYVQDTRFLISYSKWNYIVVWCPSWFIEQMQKSQCQKVASDPAVLSTAWHPLRLWIMWWMVFSLRTELKRQHGYTQSLFLYHSRTIPQELHSIDQSKGLCQHRPSRGFRLRLSCGWAHVCKATQLVNHIATHSGWLELRVSANADPRGLVQITPLPQQRVIRHRDIQKDKHAYADRWTNGQTSRQTGRQAGRHTQTHQHQLQIVAS
jgi:hypothetical protein